jgi:YHS domain-containing protein
MMAMRKDPVCGMDVEPNEAAGETEYRGQTYYFCCEECKHLFDQDPANYISKEPVAGTRP